MSTDDWCTPPEVADRLDELWDGPADIDPCSNGRSIIRAKRAYTAGGLHLPWGKKTFENNPYSCMLPWVRKGIRELEAGNIDELVTLWPVSTSTGWWKEATGREPVPPQTSTLQKYVTAPNPTIIFPKRLAFIDERGVQIKGCRFDSVLFFYGPPKRHKDFLHVFSGLINWAGTGR